MESHNHPRSKLNQAKPAKSKPYDNVCLALNFHQLCNYILRGSAWETEEP